MSPTKGGVGADEPCMYGMRGSLASDQTPYQALTFTSYDVDSLGGQQWHHSVPVTACQRLLPIITNAGLNSRPAVRKPLLLNIFVLICAQIQGSLQAASAPANQPLHLQILEQDAAMNLIAMLAATEPGVMYISQRKRRSKPVVSSPVKIHPFTTGLKADEDEVSLLLDLPAELRNIVYGLIIRSGPPIKLHDTNRHPNLGIPFLLSRVNRQLHHEFSAAVFVLGDISTKVYGYDFRHIVAFLNRLSAQTDIPALPSIHSTRAGRKITIELTPEHEAGTTLHEPKYLERWINRAAHPTKKGTSVRFVYVLAPRLRALGGAFILEGRVDGWERRAHEMPQGRKREELDKIIAAVRSDRAG
ncbi:hypothetical protein LTR53_010475 [Teratosphaeriaceae sp. CCFEE 6253]|nr:hypothetical protein LTR53_010475 [Teratosphaeriaceae sp. CCFEE 6253]